MNYKEETLHFASAHQAGPDPGHIAWACYFLLGAGFLAPWNALITATDYFSSVYPSRHMDRLFTLCYLPTCLVFLGLTLRFSTLVSRYTRIVVGFLGFTLIMVLIPVLDRVMVAGHERAPKAAMGVVLAAVVVIGMLDGICQGAIFGDAATLPPRYTHAVVGGTASSGLIISLLRIVTKASLGTSAADRRLSTAIYFTLAAAMSALCLIMYTQVLPRLMVVRLQRHDEAGAVHGDPSNTSGMPREHAVAPLAGSPALPPSSVSLSDSPTASSLSRRQVYAPDPASDLDQQQERLLGHSHQEVDSMTCKQAAKVDLLAVWRSVREVAISLLLLYTITLSIFPGFLAEDVKSAALGDWYPILLMAAFNAADLVGKLWPFDASRWTPTQLLTCAVLRTVFIPAFIAAAMLGAGPGVITILTFMLGCSNGFLTAVSMALAGLLVPPHEAEASETIAVFAMVAGLNVGAYAGWLWLL